jgi:L,D-peptidoglycan transpeptidase YkuD (ErfK/YbiS/YcfS/YnhG family)
MRLIRWLLVIPVAAALLAGAAPLPAYPAPASSYTRTTKPAQVVTVKVASTRATTGVLEVWTRMSNGRYMRVYGPIPAHVGAAGIGTAHAGSTRTPAGVWGLTQSFGIAPNPRSGLPYFQVDNNDWWVGDSSSPYYNHHYRCAPGHCPFDERVSEHLLSAGAVYGYAAMINYNTAPAHPHAGAAFFLHMTDNTPTAGCVAIPRVNIIWLLRYLHPNAHPVISIGLSFRAYQLMW